MLNFWLDFLYIIPEIPFVVFRSFEEFSYKYVCPNVSLVVCKCVQLCFLGIMFGNILEAVS